MRLDDSLCQTQTWFIDAINSTMTMVVTAGFISLLGEEVGVTRRYLHHPVTTSKPYEVSESSSKRRVGLISFTGHFGWKSVARSWLR